MIPNVSVAGAQKMSASQRSVSFVLIVVLQRWKQQHDPIRKIDYNVHPRSLLETKRPFERLNKNINALDIHYVFSSQVSYDHHEKNVGLAVLMAIFNRNNISSQLTMQQAMRAYPRCYFCRDQEILEHKQEATRLLLGEYPGRFAATPKTFWNKSFVRKWQLQRFPLSNKQTFSICFQIESNHKVYQLASHRMLKSTRIVLNFFRPHEPSWACCLLIISAYERINVVWQSSFTNGETVPLFIAVVVAVHCEDTINEIDAQTCRATLRSCVTFSLRWRIFLGGKSPNSSGG